jgi:hypothetical protein
MFSRIFRYAIATAGAERDVAANLRCALISPKVTLFEQFSLYYQLNKGKEPWYANNQNMQV